MARKKANYPLIEGLEITTLAAEGKAMGRWNDVVVFVPLTVPGDVVDVQIRSKRRRFMEGFVVRYVRKSPLRAEAFCAHFGVCGGCKWQNLPYEEQLRFKTEQVRVEAMQNAKQSAQTLAGAIGQNVGKCFYIYDSNNNVMPVLYDNMAVMRSAKTGYGEEAAADEPLDFKTIKLQYNVQAKFVLE